MASESVSAINWVNTVLLPDLETIYPGVTAANTGVAVKMHWPTVPTALGSYTCYKPGQWATWGLEGSRVGNSHFCGEHCSLDFQGWMEGAAETGMLVAAEILDDHSITPTSAHEALLALKLVVPQASYHAGQPRRGSLIQRRRQLRDAWRATRRLG
jgi:hypothetical protein